MSRITRGALLALAAFFALAFAASTATATGTYPVRVNTTLTTASALNSTLLVNINEEEQSVVTCREFNLNLVLIDSDGDVTIPARTIEFLECTINGNEVEITQEAEWTGVIRHLDSSGNVSAVTLDVTVPAGGVSFNGIGCFFTVGGTALGEYRTSPTVAHNVLTLVPSIRFPASLAPNPLSLVVADSNFICNLIGLTDGDLGMFNADFVFRTGDVIGLGATH